MESDWSLLFDAFGIKKVTRTDKIKAAYVLDKSQVHAIENAGRAPSNERPATPFTIKILCDPITNEVNASYYHALREGTDRPPEPRLGKNFISSWLHEGDSVLIGNIGTQIFAVKIPEAALSDAAVVAAVAAAANTLSRKEIFRRAKLAKGRPKKRQISTSDYERNKWVIMAALIRADGQCEMPHCNRELFQREDGAIYLEVHHIRPLGEGGEDALENVAALCPHCHRFLHFAKKRMAARALLLKQARSRKPGNGL